MAATPVVRGVIDLSLQRIVSLLGLLGNPHLKFRTVHVAGTNGKGTVTTCIETALRRAGVRTGKYTSPHLIEPRDTCQVLGRPVDQQCFSACRAAVLDAAGRLSLSLSASRAAAAAADIEPPTEFEILTATAFMVFAERDVQVAVVEVGVGGRLDATNVFPAPWLTVITRIALDHVALLGPDIASIARQKAGILKPGVPTVFSRQPFPEAAAVLEQEAIELKATYLWAGHITPASATNGNEFHLSFPSLSSYSSASSAKLSSASSSSSLGMSLEPLLFLNTINLEDLHFQLPGPGPTYVDNCATAAAALCVLWQTWDQHMQSAGIARPPLGDLLKSIGAAKWPGRYSWFRVDKKSLQEATHDSSFPSSSSSSSSSSSCTGSNTASTFILVDGAHNRDGTKALRDYIDDLMARTFRGGEQRSAATSCVSWIWSLSTGREPGDFALDLFRRGDRVVCCQFSPPAGMPWVRPVELDRMRAAAEHIQRKETGAEADTKDAGDWSASTPPESNKIVNVSENVSGALRILGIDVSTIAASSEQEWITSNNHANEKYSDQGMAASLNLVIVCGSLYLISDFYRCLPSSEI